MLFLGVFYVRVVLLLEECLNYGEGLICFVPLLPFDHIICVKVVSDFHLKNRLDDHGFVGTFHLRFESFFLLLFEERKICHDVLVQVSWCGELFLAFKFLSVVELESHAILEERDDLYGWMLFVPNDKFNKVMR